MVWYESYLLVDLLPPFLKTFASNLDTRRRGRQLSGETDARARSRLEIGTLEMLTRDLNALQVLCVGCLRLLTGRD